MATTEQQRYVLHLNHALAMESAIVDLLEKRINDISEPELRQRFLQHRDETIRHRDTVRSIIESLGEEPTSSRVNLQSPVAPGMLGKIMTALESEKEDRLLLQALADYSLACFEVGVYLTLGRMAANLGFPEHVSRFDTIRRQEEGMTEFIKDAFQQAVNTAFPPVRRAA